EGGGEFRGQRGGGGGPRWGAGGDGRKKQYPRTRRGDHARHRRARPPAPGARAGDLGILSQESRRRGEHPSADLRGEGGRLPGRAGQGDGQAGFARGAAQGRRGRQNQLATRPAALRARIRNIGDAAGAHWHYATAAVTTAALLLVLLEGSR